MEIENFGGFENFEPRLFIELQEAQDESDRIMKEIEKHIEGRPDKDVAEKEALEKFGQQLDESLKKVNEAFKKWMESINNHD